MRTPEQLANVLESEAEVSEELLVAMKEKQDSLIHFKADAMGAAVDRERLLLKQMQDLERQRELIVADLVSGVPGLQRSSKNPTVRQIVPFVADDTGARLLDLAKRIKNVSGRVQRTNQQNRFLLDSSAKFIKNTLRILTEDHRRQLVDKTI